MKNTLLLAALAPLTLAGCGTSAQTPTSSPDLAQKTAPGVVGGWKSACTPASDTQGFVLDFDIGEKTWAVDYTVFGDKPCTSRFLTVHIEGPYEIGQPSATVAGAYEARFAFTRKTVTPHSAAAAAFLSSDGGCKIPGFAEGVAKDVGVTGCAALGQYPIATCPADYDLVKVEGDSLTFGARPKDNDMCTPDKRPQALAPLSSRRK